MKTGSCSKCGYLSLCDEHRKQALADNFDAIKNMSRPANPPTPTVLETSVMDQTPESIVYMVANIANRPDLSAVQEEQVRRIREYGKRVERETLERAAKECIEADQTGTGTGQFYAKVVLSVSGDSTS